MSTMRATPPLEIGWIDLDGVDNMRDLAGTPTTSGQIAPHRLIRSDNLDRLPPASIETLVNHLEVSDVVDLRTNFELTRIGSGPLRQDPRVRVTAGSLYPEDDPSGAVPPWLRAADPWAASSSHVEATSQHYLDYLQARPDTVLAALRVIAGARGATVVHCAAGKDRTGTIIALALSALGAPEDLIVADYAATGQRLARIITSLGRAAAAGSATQGAYAGDDQSTPPEIMGRTLDLIDSQLGGVPRYLERIGWTGADQARLEAHLTHE